MAAVSSDGGDRGSALQYGCISPTQQFLYFSNRLLQQYQQQGDAVALGSVVSEAGSTTSSSGDYQVTAQEVINSPQNAYQVLELLGRGTFGQVMRCWKKDSNEVVAVKIVNNLPAYTKQGQVEVDVLTTLSKLDSDQFNFVQAYESFSHHGHICIVFECLQINLYDYLKKNRLQPLPLKHIRPIAQQVLTCLQMLGILGLVHADLKPENIMLVDQDRHPFRVKVIDFGLTTRPSADLSTTCLQSRHYRAPEVILGMGYDEAIDMWSLGCVLAELFLGWPLFPGNTEYDQMNYISQMLGEPPQTLSKNVVKMCEFYRRDCRGEWVLKAPAQIQQETGLEVCPKEAIFTSVGAIGQVSLTHCHGNTEVSQDTAVAEHQDRQQFISLLEMLLTFDPTKRANPTCCLQHPFITMSHLSNSPCACEWIECMRVCWKSHTTTSSPQNVAPTATPTLFPTYPYMLDSAYHPGHTHPPLVPLSPHWVSDYHGPANPSLDTGYVPADSSLLVDTGYVSADSSPIATSLHSLMDCHKVELIHPHPYPPFSVGSIYSRLVTEETLTEATIADATAYLASHPHHK